MTTALPVDRADAVLVGRVWRPDVAGPAVVAVRGDQVVDITASSPTMRDLCEAPDPVAAAGVPGESIGSR